MMIPNPGRCSSEDWWSSCPRWCDATDPQKEVVANDDKEIDNAPDDFKDVTEDVYNEETAVVTDYNDSNEDSSDDEC